MCLSHHRAEFVIIILFVWKRNFAVNRFHIIFVNRGNIIAVTFLFCKRCEFLKMIFGIISKVINPYQSLPIHFAWKFFEEFFKTNSYRLYHSIEFQFVPSRCDYSLYMCQLLPAKRSNLSFAWRHCNTCWCIPCPILETYELMVVKQ